MFQTDAHFLLGGKHARQGMPCQDYAIAETIGNGAYAIVSDGCSTGGHTDVGSRLMALYMAGIRRDAFLVQQEQPEFTPSLHDHKHCRFLYLVHNCESLGLKTDDLLATSLLAVATPETAFVHVEGDGVVILSYDSGTKIVHAFDWGNMPYYPIYRNGRAGAFRQAHAENGTALTETRWVIPAEEEAYCDESFPYSVEEGMKGITLTPDYVHPRYGKLTQIALFSDGIEQVDQMEPVDAYKTFSTFKGTGVFVRRWLSKHVKDSQKFGLGPQDDIACAVIQILEDDT